MENTLKTVKKIFENGKPIPHSVREHTSLIFNWVQNCFDYLDFIIIFQVQGYSIVLYFARYIKSAA